MKTTVSRRTAPGADRSLAVNILALAELKTVAAAFCSAKVDVMALKGAYLISEVYSNIYERQISDIDLLVRKKDLGAAELALKRTGYTLLEGHSGRTFIRREGAAVLAVDLHSAIPYADETEVWAGACSYVLDGQKLYSLAPEQNLLYLCYHMAGRHADLDEKWLRDIGAIFAKFDIAPEKLAALADKYGLREVCYHALNEASERLGLAIPQNALEVLKPGSSIKNFIVRAVCSGKNRVPFADYFMELVVHPRTLLRTLFPSPAFMKERYGAKMPLMSGFYIVRPVVLAFKGALGAFGLLFSLRRGGPEHVRRM